MRPIQLLKNTDWCYFPNVKSNYAKVRKSSKHIYIYLPRKKSYSGDEADCVTLVLQESVRPTSKTILNIS